jgi:hypothetical protein
VIKKIPVIVQLSEEDVKSLDLFKELKINTHILDVQLARQPSRYAYWAELHATVSAKVSQLQEDLDNLEAKLFIRYSKEGERVTDIKHRIRLNPKYQRYSKRLRLWSDSERYLSKAEKAFDQRLSSLMCLNANKRKSDQQE